MARGFGRLVLPPNLTIRSGWAGRCTLDMHYTVAETRMTTAMECNCALICTTTVLAPPAHVAIIISSIVPPLDYPYSRRVNAMTADL